MSSFCVPFPSVFLSRGALFPVYVILTYKRRKGGTMAPSKNADRIRVTLYLPKHLVEEARHDDLSLSALVTVLLREYLTAGRAWKGNNAPIRGENRERACAGRDSNPGRRRGRPTSYQARLPAQPCYSGVVCGHQSCTRGRAP